MKTVLVTGIGGNVGQGIIRNIKSLNLDIRIVGCNINMFSAGNHLCDAFYKTSFAYNINFIQEIISIVEKEAVDLVIPSTDYEVYYLSKYKKLIPTRIVVSSEDTARIYLDKYKTFIFHKQNSIPFAKTYLPSQYKKHSEEIIAKPRYGRGSRGVVLNPQSLNIYSDKEFVIQKYYHGIEITIPFYVNMKKKLHGFIALVRSLDNGMSCETRVENSYDDKIDIILKQIVEKTDICGSANLQAIITNDEQIIPFEVNCRISGTNSIRANFGFQDVKYTLQEFLYNEVPDIPLIKKGIAVRIFMDIIYPNANSTDECLTSQSKHYLF